MKTVTVFLSTYNGEKYLAEQLDSILQQKRIVLRLIIRDDFSSDGTIRILDTYARKYDCITLYKGNKNLGYIKSFMWLVTHCNPNSSDYFAFSDQDDVWDEDKLYQAVRKLEKKDQKEPLLYYSDLKVVDMNGKFIKFANNWEGTITKYKIATFIGIRGCTMVYNSTLQSLLYDRVINDISGHDTYIALVAFWLGRVIYDEEAYINYRQTGSNLSITGTSSFDHFKKNLIYFYRRLTVRKCIHEKNAKELISQYGDKYYKQLLELKEIAEYKKKFSNKIKLLSNEKYKDFSKSIVLFNDIFIILGKL